MKPLAQRLMPLLVALGSVAGAQDVDGLRLKQQAQAQARASAEQLISAVLDLQLRQLEENGLKSLPMYRDIAAMKTNIGSLTHDEMERIVVLLSEAQQGPRAQREGKMSAARSLVREVVVRLMAERQKLDRRLQVARLSN